MRIYSDPITDQTIVTQGVAQLTPWFDHVVSEESKDLTILTIDELSGARQAHEARFNRSPK